MELFPFNSNESLFKVLEFLALGLKAERMILWIVVEDQLKVVSQYHIPQVSQFKEVEISQEETVKLLLEWGSKTLYSSSGVISVFEVEKNVDLKKSSKTLFDELQNSNTKSRILSEIRSESSKLYGFLEAQSVRSLREWIPFEACIMKVSSDQLNKMITSNFTNFKK